VSSRPTSPRPTPGRCEPYSIDDDDVAAERLGLIFEVVPECDEAELIGAAEEGDEFGVVFAAGIECVVDVLDALEVDS
jgi:hypothetical protein